MISNLKLLIKSHLNIKKAIAYNKAYGQIIKDGLFNEGFYRRNYLFNDLDDPLMHYLFEGYKRGYDPSVKFSTEKYLKKYGDVKRAGINPLVHYVNHGKDEGREIFESELLTKEEILNLNKNQLNNYEFDEEPLVSIIVLNKSKLGYLKILFKDFSKKTNYSNFELILVDNNSRDKSIDYVKSLDLDFPLHIIKNDENLSFSKGNNDASKIANGEYLLFMNNDIETTYGWLNEMMGAMLNNENVGSVGAKLVFPYEPQNKAKSLKIQHASDIFNFKKHEHYIYAYNVGRLNDAFDEKYNDFKKVVAVTGATLLMKKSVFEEIGGFDEDYIYGYEDVDLSLKLHKMGYDIHYCPTALLFHHERGTRKFSTYYRNNVEKLYQKWENYLNREIYLDKINGKGFFCEHPLKLLFIVENTKELSESCLKLIEICKAESYEFELTDNSKLIDTDSETDIVLSFVSSPNINNDLRKNLIKISCLNKSEIANCEFYDLILNDNFDDFKSILTEHIMEKYEK